VPFTLPDKGEGASNSQSILFQEDLEILAAGIAGTDCVLFGLAVTAQGSPDMTVAVAKGAVLSNGVMYAVAAANGTITTADGTNPRIDAVVITSAGAIAVRAGTAAANPKPPNRTANDVVLAYVYVPASDTTIATDQIVDKRVLRSQGPICIYKQTTADTVNTSSAAIHLLNRANSGLTIPSGMMVAGRVLRVRVFGHILYNSGTPTATLIVSFGGTTMFQDVSGASTADTDRAPFTVDFVIVAQGNSDQSMTGIAAMGLIAAKTAPTTGRGDAWSTANNVNAINGDSAVDADAANRLLAVTHTFSVSNAANEITVEGALVEWL
jgi:hypothetical protein